MSSSQSQTRRHKHQRSSSRKLFDSQPQTDHETVLFIENTAPFDVQYYVEKSGEQFQNQTLIVDQLTDQGNISGATRQQTRSGYVTKLSKAHKQIDGIVVDSPFNNCSEYFPHWDEQVNFACLSKLKNRFHNGPNDQNNRIKSYRERHKNKLLQINAEYQIENSLILSLEQWEDATSVQTPKYSTRKSTRLMDRKRL